MKDIAGAYLAQARSDYVVFQLLVGMDRAQIPECHALHYLQMATEKLGKAAMLELELKGFDRFSHVAFSQLPFQLGRSDIARALGWANSASYRAFLRKASPLFRRVDELNPAVGTQAQSREGPSVEYPWQARDTRGAMIWIAPANHQFALVREMRVAGVLQFIETLLARFEGVFR